MPSAVTPDPSHKISSACSPSLARKRDHCHRRDTKRYTCRLHYRSIGAYVCDTLTLYELTEDAKYLEKFQQLCPPLMLRVWKVHAKVQCMSSTKCYYVCDPYLAPRVNWNLSTWVMWSERVVEKLTLPQWDKCHLHVTAWSSEIVRVSSVRILMTGSPEPIQFHSKEVRDALNVTVLLFTPTLGADCGPHCSAPPRPRHGARSLCCRRATKRWWRPVSQTWKNWLLVWTRLLLLRKQKLPNWRMSFWTTSGILSVTNTCSGFKLCAFAHMHVTDLQRKHRLPLRHLQRYDLHLHEEGCQLHPAFPHRWVQHTVNLYGR